MLDSVANCLEVLAGRGLLTIPEPSVAAQHFSGTLLWIPSNRVMFEGPQRRYTEEELRNFIDLGVQAFISASRHDDKE